VTERSGVRIVGWENHDAAPANGNIDHDLPVVKKSRAANTRFFAQNPHDRTGADGNAPIARFIPSVRDSPDALPSANAPSESRLRWASSNPMRYPVAEARDKVGWFT
jgi:hypothetical protein